MYHRAESGAKETQYRFDSLQLGDKRFCIVQATYSNLSVLKRMICLRCLPKEQGFRIVEILYRHGTRPTKANLVQSNNRTSFL